MPKVTWILANEQQLVADVREGTNLMDAAVQNGVHGVVGECGGGLMCATCHVYVEPGHEAATGAAGAMESDLLDMTVAPRQSGSRLSCQIVATEAMDGLVLRVPAI